jgi:hypothetical protein
MTTYPRSGNTALAVENLASRLGVDTETIEVVSVEEVTWPDGSLGCPDTDMRYTQALVNGQLIVLEFGGTRYEYHSGGGRPPFYCPPWRATPPVGGCGRAI